MLWKQLIIMGQGALRMSASNFKEEVDQVNKSINQVIEKKSSLKNYVIAENETL